MANQLEFRNRSSMFRLAGLKGIGKAKPKTSVIVRSCSNVESPNGGNLQEKSTVGLDKSSNHIHIHTLRIFVVAYGARCDVAAIDLLQILGEKFDRTWWNLTNESSKRLSFKFRFTLFETWKYPEYCNPSVLRRGVWSRVSRIDDVWGCLRDGDSARKYIWSVSISILIDFLFGDSCWSSIKGYWSTLKFIGSVLLLRRVRGVGAGEECAPAAIVRARVQSGARDPGIVIYTGLAPKLRLHLSIPISCRKIYCLTMFYSKQERT